MKTQKTKWPFDGGHVDLSVRLSASGDALSFSWTATLAGERACRNTPMGERLIPPDVCNVSRTGVATDAGKARVACEKAAGELRDAYLKARETHLKQCIRVEELAASLEGEWPVDISRDEKTARPVDNSSD